MFSMGLRKSLNYTWNLDYTVWNKNVIWWFHPNTEHMKHHSKSLLLHYALSLITSCTVKTCKTVYVAIHQIHVLWRWWWWQPQQQQQQNTHSLTVAHCRCRTFIPNSWWNFFSWHTHCKSIANELSLFNWIYLTNVLRLGDDISTSLYVRNK